MKMSLKKSLVVVAMSSMFIGNAMALDAIFFIPKVVNTILTSSSISQARLLENTENSARDVSRSYNAIDALFYAFWFPFAILNEESGSVEASVSDLVDLSYTAEEIAQYESDLAKISGLVSSSTFSSQEQAAEAISALDLGIVAKEQMRIK
jgi:hypothetical protein